MKAAILAGGLGTRLRPVLPDQPKCLAPAGSTAFVELLFAQLREAGFCEVVLLLGHRADRVCAYLADRTEDGLQFETLVEDTPLGTGGAVVQALPRLGASFLLLNGDSLADVDLRGLSTHHRTSGADATLAAAAVADASASGSIVCDEAGRITTFDEKTHAGPSLVNAGVYAFQATFFAGLPAGVPLSLERDILPDRLSTHFCTFYRAAGFQDIGTPERLAGFVPPPDTSGEHP